MADSQDRLLASTHEEFVRGIADGITEENVVVNQLNRRNKIVMNKSGTTIDWRVRTAKNTSVKNWDLFDEITFTPQNPFKTASIRWGGIAGGYTIAWTDLQENKAPNAIFDLQRQELINLKSDVLESIEDGLLNATDDGKGLIGTGNFIKATGTYATLDLTSAFWAPTITAGNAGPNTSFATDVIERMTTNYVNVSKGGGQRSSSPDFIVTDRATWVVLHDKLQSLQRLASDDDLIDAGFPNILFMSAPVVWDDSMVTAEMQMLNLRHLEFWATTEMLLEATSEMKQSPKSFIASIVTHFQLISFANRFQSKITLTST